MLPTPSTSHVSFDNIYEPAEDSFLLLDTLSSQSETAFLHDKIGIADGKRSSPTPLVVEIGSGSGVVLAFASAHSGRIFGRHDVLTLGVDINRFACKATAKTVQKALRDVSVGPPASQKTTEQSSAEFLDSVNAELTGTLRAGSVDVLIFNPPYVPTEALPDPSKHHVHNDKKASSNMASFEQDSYLISLSYAGGSDGMEVTNRLLGELATVLHPGRGVAYVLLCAQNKPEEVKQMIRSWGKAWAVETVGRSGKQGGWEKLQIVRIWRDVD